MGVHEHMLHVTGDGRFEQYEKREIQSWLGIP